MSLKMDWVGNSGNLVVTAVIAQEDKRKSSL